MDTIDKKSIMSVEVVQNGPDWENDDNYTELLSNIDSIIKESRREVCRSVNTIMVRTYWVIGKHIVEYEQHGKIRAEYGSHVLDRLSKDLKQRYGSGFSRSNLIYMRLFYLKYPNSETLSHQLTWSHYFELLKIEDKLERGFYEKQCINERWSVRELKRQKNSALFHRLALSKDKEGVIALSKAGHIIEKDEDIIKDPYILEFLGLERRSSYSETELEQRIIDNMKMFLLELGRGFAFICRQYRITLDNTHYYIDLVFYHTKLKCYVLIDLKVGRVKPQDIGQMNAYLTYFLKEENAPDDNPPIGIILGSEKERIMVEYALGGLSNKLFVSKYKIYLPDKYLLERELRSIIGEG